MDYTLEDLIDMEQFQSLQDRLNEIYSFPSAIIDNDGKVLTATAWQDICTKFHRQNKESEKECVKSDQYILAHLADANPAVSYQCPHGLIDNATPIVVDGKHLGNFFTGQFFLEKPDLAFFKNQAERYGFDEETYLAAVRSVPIWSKEQLNSYLFFIKGLIQVITSIALKNMRSIESGKKMRESEERHRSVFQTAMDGFWLADRDGHLLEVNEAYCRMSGYTAEELLTMSISDLDAVESPAETAARIRQLIEKGQLRFESRQRRKDGRIYDVQVSASFSTRQQLIIASLHDITERKKEEEFRNKLTDQVPGVIYQYRLYPDGRSCFPYSSSGMSRIYEVSVRFPPRASSALGRVEP